MLGRMPKVNTSITRRRRERGGRERAGAQQEGWEASRGRRCKWASKGRSRATHRRTGAAYTWGAVLVGKCVRKGARWLKGIASDSLSIVVEKNAIMWALDGRSWATHTQDKRAANKGRSPS